jgi:hypothetical protein
MTERTKKYLNANVRRLNSNAPCSVPIKAYRGQLLKGKQNYNEALSPTRWQYQSQV